MARRVVGEVNSGSKTIRSKSDLDFLYTDPGTLINIFEHSAYGQQQNDSDFPVFVFFGNQHLFPALHFSVESQSDSPEHFQWLVLDAKFKMTH